MNYTKRFSSETIKMMACDSKIGVLATTDAQGYPHLTFLSSIEALDETHLAFGKFSAGRSRRFLDERPNAGFLILDTDKRFVSGFATYTHAENAGDVYDRFNAKPLFRYNSYMGFSEVCFLDLVGVTAIEPLPMGRIVAGAVLSRIRAIRRAKSTRHALPPVAKALFDQMDSLKFFCYTDKKGRLTLLPIVQATAAGTDRIVFSSIPYGDRLKRAQAGCKAAILCVNLNMESVLVKGVYTSGQLEIEQVYNSMPPKIGVVYPRDATLKPVTGFDATPPYMR